MLIWRAEDLAAYGALLAHVSKCVKPKYILEKLWIRDAVHLTWEVLRWRRLMTNLLTGFMWPISSRIGLGWCPEISCSSAATPRSIFP